MNELNFMIKSVTTLREALRRSVRPNAGTVRLLAARGPEPMRGLTFAVQVRLTQVRSASWRHGGSPAASSN